jgi:hypothetical protein
MSNLSGMPKLHARCTLQPPTTQRRPRTTKEGTILERGSHHAPVIDSAIRAVRTFGP